MQKSTLTQIENPDLTHTENSELTQMDIGKWFRHIEYLVGILYTIADKKRANSLTKSLIRSSNMFLNYANNYYDITESNDVEVMINRIKIIIENLNQKMIINSNLPDETNPYENITFFELEKWKQHIMYMVGVMMSKETNKQQILKSNIRKSIKILFVYAECYLNKLDDEDDKKTNDIKVLLVQIINIYNNLK